MTMPKPKRERRLQFTNLQNPFQRFRSRTGLSQGGLAAALNLRQSTISKYETGGMPDPLHAKRFIALCRKHNVVCSMDEIYANLEMS